MRLGKIRSTLAVIFIYALLLWFHTYYLAFHLISLQGYEHIALEGWSIADRWVIYLPYQGISWMMYLPASSVLVAHSKIMLGGMAIGVLIIGYGVRYQQRQQEIAFGTYGSARWMRNDEIKVSGLINGTGVFLGKTKQDYLRHAGPEHVIALAPTRSGKGVGLVIPTLLTYPGSVLVHDIKGENWQLTSGWRSQFSDCLYFNPVSAESVRFNPLLQIRKGLHEIRDAQNIADILVDPDGGSDKRDYWAKTGHVLLVAVILHILYTAKEKTLASVAEFLSDPKRDIRTSLEVMMQTLHLQDRPHPVIAASAREMLNKADSELSGVISTAMSFLALYRDPMIARATSTSDFTITDLMQRDRPVSLYLVVPPSDISRTRPLVRLILNQIARTLTEAQITYGDTPYKHRLLLLIDEFPALGRLEFFEQALAYTASYGIHAYLICQSLNQLDKIYGPNHSILDHCHVRVVYASNDDKTAQRISQLLGQSTYSNKRSSYSGKVASLLLPQISVSQQDSARPLLTAGEIMTLADHEGIIMMGGKPPIRAEKIRYYEDANFKGRVMSPPILSVFVPLFIAANHVEWLKGEYIKEEIFFNQEMNERGLAVLD